MNFTEFLIRRPVLSTVLSIIVIMIGAVSWSRLSLRQFPQIDKPIISVETQLEGASPQIVEAQLTRPLEEVLGGVEGLDYMTSRSEPENSVVKLNFKVDRDMDAAAADVRDRLQRVRNQLPDDATDPLIKKADADAQPIIYVALYSNRKTVGELADYARRYLESDLETIKGVAKVEIYGGGQLEMHLVLDPVKLAAYKITATDVTGALKRQNVKKPAGRLSGEDREFMVTVKAALNSTKQFNEMIIAERDGRLIRLKDVGYAELNTEDKRFASRFNDKNAVSLGLIKQSVANPLTIKKELERKIERIRSKLPTGTEITLSYDKTVFIERSIDQVYQTIFEAILLVILVVFVFLRSVRASIVPLVTIPVSLIGAFALMYLFGFTINILTMLAMVLAIGLVVDDAIVVLENVYRYIEKGMKPFEAAIKGTQEISFAVVAMTLTLAAVYAPIALSSGMTGRLFTEFALTLAGAVIISGFVALTLSPMMCARLLRSHDEKKSDNESSLAKAYHKFDEVVGHYLDKLDIFYKNTLEKALNLRLWVVGSGVAVALVGLFLAQFQLNKELTPDEDQGVLRTISAAPYGATLKSIEKYALEADKILASVPELEKRMSIIQVGDESYSLNTMTPWEKRSRSCSDVKTALTPELDKIIGLQVTATCVKKSLVGGGSGDDLQFVIQTTRSYDELQEQMQRVWALMERHPGISRVRPDVGDPGQDYEVRIDIDKAATLGVEPDVLAQTLDTLIGGRRATYFERENRKYPVRVWVGEQYRRSPDDVLAMYVRGVNDNKETLVPLKDLVKVDNKQTTPEIYHFEGLRSVTLRGFINEGYGLGQVLASLEAATKQILPDGYQTTVSGQTRDFLQESNTIILIFSLAIVFIYLVMAAQFESFVDPFIIILSVPLSLAGAILTLWIVGGSINIYSQIGLVTLIGLITKHGILIVDFSNKLQDKGLSPFEAVVEAAKLRLRPILMTTFAMVLGAIPLALSSGAGSETREQIGWTIVGGMTIGTVFTLFVIPVVYTYLTRNRQANKAAQ